MKEKYMNEVRNKILLVLSLLVITPLILADESAVATLQEKLKERVAQATGNPLAKATPELIAPKKDPSLEAPIEKNKEKEEPISDEAEEKNIFLNFEDTQLMSFVNYMAEMKQLNIIPDKKLEETKISLSIRTPLNVDGAWRIFLTVLEMSNFTIAKVGDIYKIVPNEQAGIQPLPAYINTPPKSLPDSDERIRYVAFLENISIKSVEPLLQSMLSEKQKVFAHEDSNGFVIMDKSFNIKSAMTLLNELDASGQTETVVVMKLKNVNATDVKELLTSLIKDDAQQSPLAKFLGKSAESSGKYFPPGTKIIAEERTNSLILMGLTDVIKKIEDFITTNVDTKLKAAESPLHIYELQYTNAQQIAAILQDVIQAPEGGPGQQAAKYGAIRSGVKYFKNMTFAVDNDGNRLIISCTDKDDWELIKKTIQDLDKPQPQVAIETLFVSVTASDLKQLGGSLRNKNHNQLGHVDFQSTPLSGNLTFEGGTDNASSLLGNMLNQLINTQGSSILSFGKKNNIWGLLESIKTVTNASILSQPFLTVANKTKATLEFGNEQRVKQEQGSDQTGFIAVSATTKLEVEPQINLDGVIRLKITIGVADFLNTNGDKQEKNVNTSVTIADGQVLILGGFIQSKVTTSKSKTPLLGDIPIISWLFKNEKKTVDESYIFIFMCPTIIKPREIPGIGLYTRMKLQEATTQIDASAHAQKSRDPIYNWFFNPDENNYAHKVIDYANARYQPTTVDIKNDLYYRSNIDAQSMGKELAAEVAKDLVINNTESNNAIIHQVSKPSEPVSVGTDTIKQESPPATPQKNTQDTILQKLQAKRATMMPEEQKKPAVKGSVSPSPSKPLKAEPDKKVVETVQHKPAISQPEPKKDPVITNTIIKQPEQKTAVATPVPVVEISDQKIDEKRSRLKELIAQQNNDPQPMLTSSPVERRNRLKEFLARGQEALNTPVESERRAKLKDFLAKTMTQNEQQQAAEVS